MHGVSTDSAALPIPPMTLHGFQVLLSITRGKFVKNLVEVYVTDTHGSHKVRRPEASGQGR